MLNKERHYAILTWLNRYERAMVNHLAKLFGVTKETIRSDLNTLSREGCIERCHGGAIIKRRIFHTQWSIIWIPILCIFLTILRQKKQSNPNIKGGR